MDLLYLNSGERQYGEKPFPMFTRGHWELQAILSGNARTTPNDRHPSCASPKLYVSGPQSIHGWIDDPGGCSEIVVMHCSHVPEEFHSRVPMDGGICIPLDSQGLNLLTFVRDHLHPHFRRPVDGTAAAVKAALYLMCEVIMTATASRNSNSSLSSLYNEEKVRQALHYFDQNVWHAPSVEAVASAIGLSASQMRRIFNCTLGVSPHQAMLTRRMALAKVLLRSGESVGYVAESLGFSEISAFSRAYKIWAGKPPSEDRCNERSGNV